MYIYIYIYIQSAQDPFMTSHGSSSQLLRSMNSSMSGTGTSASSGRTTARSRRLQHTIMHYTRIYYTLMSFIYVM